MAGYLWSKQVDGTPAKPDVSAMTSLAMPTPDKTTLAKRNEIIAQLREVVPGEGVVDTSNGMRVFESDGLTAYRQLPMVVVLPETVAQV